MNEKSNSYININSKEFNNNFLLNEIKQENQKLKQQVEKLKKSNLTLSVEKEELKRIINQLRCKENECLILQDTILEKEKEIENIRNILLKEREVYQEDKRKTEANYENELIHIKRDQETTKNKIDNFSKMNNLNDILYSKVLELEKNIEELKKEEEIKLNNKEIEYNNKIDKYKKRLLDFLKRGGRNNDEENQLVLNNKLNLLHIQELIEEIEFQNQEVNNLLKEKKELKIKIMNLSNDLNIYKIMVLTLAQKNDEYQKKMKSIKNFSKNRLSKTYKSNKTISLTENNNKNINKNIFNKKYNLLSPLYKKKNILLGFNLDVNHRKTKRKEDIINYTVNNNGESIKLKKDFNNMKITKNNKIESEKKIIEKYKDLYEFYKNKYDFIILKFKNIFNMYSDALEKIYNEEKNNNNDIDININDFKEFNFQQMTSEQKYSILIKLINHISPLIWKKDLEEYSFKDNIFKVKQKYNIYDLKSNSIFAKTHQNFHKKNIFQSKENSLKNSPKGCNISTYFSTVSQKNDKNKFNKHCHSALRFSKIKGHHFILQNLRIPQFKELKIDNINNSPFKYY